MKIYHSNHLICTHFSHFFTISVLCFFLIDFDNTILKVIENHFLLIEYISPTFCFFFHFSLYMHVSIAAIYDNAEDVNVLFRKVTVAMSSQNSYQSVTRMGSDSIPHQLKL